MFLARVIINDRQSDRGTSSKTAPGANEWDGRDSAAKNVRKCTVPFLHGPFSCGVLPGKLKLEIYTST